MQPAVPEQPGGGSWGGGDLPPGIDVGPFPQGSPFSRWALARYLVGRAIASSVSDSLMVLALVLLGLAAAVRWGLSVTWFAVLLAVVAIGVLVLRWAVVALVGRVTGLRAHAPVEAKLRALVGDTRRDVLRELRRLGLPSHRLTLPLLAVRLLGRRRQETVQRLRGFETERAVPAARLDELHLLLRGDTLGPPR